MCLSSISPVRFRDCRKEKGSRAKTAPRSSVFARQINHIIGEPQRHALFGEVRERDRLGENRVVVAVLAGEGAAVVGIDCQLPYLKSLGSDFLVEVLREGD